MRGLVYTSLDTMLDVTLDDERAMPGELVSVMHAARVEGLRVLRAAYPRKKSVKRHGVGKSAVWYFEAVREPIRNRIVEYDARCLYCLASLNTIAPNYRKIPLEFYTPMERHGAECALRFLLIPEHERAEMTRSELSRRLKKMRGIR